MRSVTKRKRSIPCEIHKGYVLNVPQMSRGTYAKQKKNGFWYFSLACSRRPSHTVELPLYSYHQTGEAYYDLDTEKKLGKLYLTPSGVLEEGKKRLKPVRPSCKDHNYNLGLSRRRYALKKDGDWVLSLECRYASESTRRNAKYEGADNDVNHTIHYAICSIDNVKEYYPGAVDTLTIFGLDPATVVKEGVDKNQTTWSKKVSDIKNVKADKQQDVQNPPNMLDAIDPSLLAGGNVVGYDPPALENAYDFSAIDPSLLAGGNVVGGTYAPEYDDPALENACGDFSTIDLGDPTLFAGLLPNLTSAGYDTRSNEIDYSNYSQNGGGYEQEQFYHHPDQNPNGYF